MRPARPCFPALGPPRRLPSTGSHAGSPTGGFSASAPAHRPQRWVPHAQGPQRSAPPSFPHFAAPQASKSSAIAPPLCRRSAIAPWPATNLAAPGQQLLPDRSLPQCPRPFSTFAAALRPATALARRPCQQQTSAGGEECSGLASNLAHLGLMC